jgi:hypothetical protein
MQKRPLADPLTRARSIHNKQPFTVAVFFTLLHYLCVLALVTCVVILLSSPTPRSVMTPLVISFVAALVTWLISFIRRRSARCPLCKGSPLMESGAVKHPKAYRLPPLNHGATAVFGILFLNRFRCMYCGTHYDLLKRSSTGRNAS